MILRKRTFDTHAEQDSVKKEVLIDCFLNGLSQREISQKHTIAGASVSSIISRFKHHLMSL